MSTTETQQASTTDPTDTGVIARAFLTRLGAGDGAGVLDLFADTVDWSVPGAAIVPWVGTRSDKMEIKAFFDVLGRELTPEAFATDRIVVDGDSAVVLGSFSYGVIRTGKSFASSFALHIGVSDGRIDLYHMYEDSFAIAEAFTP